MREYTGGNYSAVNEASQAQERKIDKSYARRVKKRRAAGRT
jgi:hypothetical protein